MTGADVLMYEYYKDNAIAALVAIFLAIAISAVVCISSCNQQEPQTYDIAIVYSNGQKDTLSVKAREDDDIWLGEKGCLYGSTKVIACSVRSFQIISNHPVSKD